MRPVSKLETAAAGLLLWASFAPGRAAAADDDWKPRDSPHTFYSALKPCPAACAGNPSNWTVYTSADRLAVCDEPVLLSFNVHNPLDDPGTSVVMHACTTGAGDAKTHVNALVDNSTAPAARRRRSGHLDLARRNSSTCIPAQDSRATLELMATGAGPSAGKAPDVHGALEQLQDYMREQTNCDDSIIFAYSQGAAVGVYSGAAIDNHATAPSVIQKLVDSTGSHDADIGMLIQLCGDGRNADHVFGAVVDPSGDLAAVQKAVRSWSLGLCANGTSPRLLKDVSIRESPLAAATNRTASTRRLRARGDCSTAKVVPGDSCGSLATKCKISAADFTKYNPDKSLCSTLGVGQRVCCSSGTLPDIRPKQNSDGSCAAYTVQTDDYCNLIANNNGLKVSELEGFNNGTTWGWNGCQNLQLGLNICLSKGTPPMPAPMSNAVCGPTKPGTKKPTGDQKIEELNPCPLNACCNIWGQCGIDSDFCVKELGPSKNPGTSPPGKSGCVASCGTSIVNKDTPPDEFQKIGYYESWNWERPCLNMRSTSLDTISGSYTHMHWGFAEISDGFGVSIPDTHQQFDGFKGLLGPRRIISFGGWGYSTKPETYDRLREAMLPANRDTFANNIVKFLNDNNLDGVDIDWEYPGAPDIPGIPPGKPDDGSNYLKFLVTLKGKLPAGKTLSIAAPASFWYLKAFPIDKIAKTVDYIVYMTYDLHGQWDYGSQWASPGCPTGNCLRSHVNMTETMLVLSMITKAGVATNKLFVGVSSYGRSFKMATAGCTGPDCTFVGPDSAAQKGDCTATAGYISNAEIGKIISLKQPKTWDDAVSGSQFVNWDGTQWVAYMSNAEKEGRTSRYQGFNFAGTVDWAVDLQEFGDDDDLGPTGDDDGDDDLPPTTPLAPCKDSYESLDDVEKKLDGAPFHCKALYTLMGLRGVLKQAVTDFQNMMNDGYDHKFDVYADAIVNSASTQVTNFMTNNGDKYFTCVMTEEQFCCSFCEGQWGKSECLYCHNDACKLTKRGELPGREVLLLDSAGDGSLTEPASEMAETGVALLGRGDLPPGKIDHYNIKWTNASEPCPPDYSRRGIHATGSWDQSVYWTMRKDKEASFWEDLTKETGIEKNDIAFTDVNHFGNCNGRQDTCQYQNWDFNFPQPHGYEKSDVTNPKDTAQKGLANSNNLQESLDLAIDNMALDSYSGSAFELVDAVSLPIVMLADAVDNMKKVVEVADKLEEEKRKAIIMAFLSALLFFIPIAGEVAGALGTAAAITRIITLLGTLGGAAFDTYTIIKDPENAPLAIMGLVLAPLGILDAVKVSKAANLRRAIKDEDIAKLGTKLKPRMDTVKKMTGGTCRPRK